MAKTLQKTPRAKRPNWRKLTNLSLSATNVALIKQALHAKGKSLSGFVDDQILSYLIRNAAVLRKGGMKLPLELFAGTARPRHPGAAVAK